MWGEGTVGLSCAYLVRYHVTSWFPNPPPIPELSFGDHHLSSLDEVTSHKVESWPQG